MPKVRKDKRKNIFYLTPLFIFLLATEGNLSLRPGGQQSLAVTNNPKSLIVYSSLYIFTFSIFLYNGTISFKYLKKTGIWTSLLFLLVLFSGFWTASPLPVVKEATHFFAMLLIGVLALFSFQTKPTSFFNAIFAYCVLFTLASVFIVFAAPAYGIGIDGRWQGVAAHPNHLGIVCLLGIYSSIYLFFLAEPTRVRKAFYILFNLFFFMCLLKADSVTSLLVSLFFMLTMPSFFMISSSPNLVSAIIKICLIYVVVLTFILGVYLVAPDMFTFKTFFTATGRSATLTGRLGLWDDAWKAFLEKPLLGWGFDNLKTLSKTLPGRVKYGQFHNGYLDLLVRGGMLGWLFLFGFLSSIAIKALGALKNNKEFAAALVFLFIGILIHNIAEASFMRFPNTLWMIFLCINFFISDLSGRRNKSSQRTS